MKKEFLEAVTQNEKVVYKVCRLYCKTKDDRQDLFQDIMMQLWKAFPSYRKESKVSTWIYRVALNTAITRFRKESKMPVHEDLTVDAFEYATSEEDSFDAMLHAIDKLMDIEKALIMLYLDDLSYKEISTIMGISESNVGFRLNAVKNKLRLLVNKE